MFFDQVQKLCAEKGISVTKLAEELGLSSSTTNGWKNGAEPRPVKVQQLHFNGGGGPYPSKVQ